MISETKRETTPVHLTDLAIRQLPFQETGQKRIRDSALPGFGITIGTTRKTFFVMYGPHRRLKTLGHWPETSLRDARTAARVVLAVPPPKNSATPLTEALSEWLEDCDQRLRRSTVERYRYATKHFTGGTIATLGTDSRDPHVITAIKVFLNWCVDRDYTDRNHFRNRKAVYRQRDRVLSDEEVRRLWNYDYPPYSDLVKLLLLTGQRRSQMVDIDPSWIDGDTLNFPAERMKSKRPHTIPFNLLTAQYLKPISFNGWGKSKARMDKITGVTDWVIHDLRRYYSTTMAKLGTPLHITENLLDHRSQITGVAATYNRYGFLPEMRAAITRYELHIHKIVQ